MLRPELSRIEPDDEKYHNHNELPQSRSGGIDIQRELDRLEDMILDSPRIPFTRRTLVDEEDLMEQLDLVRLNLPPAVREAEAIFYHKDEIFMQAEQYAQEIIEEAEGRADEIVDELGIIRRAELEAKQIRQRVTEECEALQEQTLAEIERLRFQAQQEIEQMRQLAIEECEEIQQGADDYADRLLKNIEQQLNDMLKVIRNGRQQLQTDPFSGGPQKPDGNPPPEAHHPSHRKTKR